MLMNHFKSNMSDPKPEEVRPAPVAEPQTERREKLEGMKPIDTIEKDFEDNSEEQEEEERVCAAMEPCTLPWPDDRKPQTDQDEGNWSEKCTSEPEDGDTGISGGSQDISEKQSHGEEEEEEEEEEGEGIGNKAKWRESMPEGERWRSDEIKLNSDKGGGSLADDEEEEEEENWRAEKGGPGFSPQVTIVQMSSKDLQEEEQRPLFQEAQDYSEPYPQECSVQYHEQPQHDDDKIYLCEDVCGEKLKLVLSTVAGALLFPLLVWGGYELLPFESPVIESAPLRVVYTLRCSMFAMIPIILGVLVQGVARLRYSSLRPLYEGRLETRQVAVHAHFVSESVGLFLFYFLQLAVMATYVSQNLVKLVPLLTIIFAFGRLIYWLCLSLRSSMRGFGFSFSFAPVLLMLGLNLYFVCSSPGQGAVFDVEPPLTEAPPKQRGWFG